MSIRDTFIPANTKGKQANGGTTEPMSQLQQLLKYRASHAAQRAEAAEMEKIALEAEAEVKRLSTGGNPAGEPQALDTERKDQLVIQAVTLLNSGVDPRVVGQILAGSTPVQGIMMPQPHSNGENTLKMVKDIVGLINETKKSAEMETIKNQLSDLKDALKDKEKGEKGHQLAPPNPLQAVADATNIVHTFYSTLKEIGFIREPIEGASNIAELKEKYRHDEKMEEIKLEQQGKNNLANLFSSGIGGIGRAAAMALREGSPGEPHATIPIGDTATVGISALDCVCGKHIAVPPEAVKVTCPACGRSYEREG